MKVSGVPSEALADIASTVGGIKVVGDASGFLLRPIDDTHRKFGRNGRRIHAVSWGGHWEFMAEMFDRYPDARLTSCLATYRGRDDFHRKAEGTRSDWAEGY